MDRSLTLNLIIQKPPAGLDYGLQMGSGSKYETVQTQRSDGVQDLHFNFNIAVKGNKQKDAMPGLSGAFVQGPSGGRFVYIDIGAYSAQPGAWGGRLKIPLTGITWDVIHVLAADATLVLETNVPGTGKNGLPNCATVKPFEGWKVKLPSS